MKKSLLLLSLIPFVLTSCSSDQTVSKKPERRIVSISLSAVQDMLSVELIREELEKRLGPPIPTVKSKDNWGNLMYEMPDKKYLFFFFEGPYITGARFDNIEVKGIKPKTYKMGFTFDVKKQKHSIHLDDKTFKDLSSFKKYLRKLPKKSIVEWQRSCISRTTIKEPIETKKEIQSFKNFCRKLDIILVYYPAG